jgi:predicted AlkP superfamily phosphohydrolase/phosphomutase
MSARVLVIGLDGVTLRVIHPLAQAGYLPNLARLIEEGTSGELRSTMPPVSGPAWHAMKTGKSPGRTGVYDFVRYDPRRYQSKLIQLGQLPGPYLWDIVDRYSDYRVGVYNLPTTYPPAQVNGFMVAGFPLPDNAPDYAFPLELKAELDGVTGAHRTDIRYRDYRRHKDFLSDVDDLIDQRVKVYHYLRDQYDPDLFFFTFTCTDRVQHRMWKYLDPESNLADPGSARYRGLLYGFWQHLDAAVGELLQSVDGNETVVVVSDHGFGPQSETFYINEWLRRRRYLKLKGEDSNQPCTASHSLLRSAREIARGAVKSLPVPGGLRRFVPEAVKRALRAETSFESMLSRIDWRRTRAYSPPHTSVFGTVYVNLERREGQGTVSHEDYDGLRDRIIDELQSLGDEIPHFQIQVFKREDLYQGRYLVQAPDVVYVINDFRCVSRSSFCQGPVFRTSSLGDDYSGTHRLDGVFVARGPSIKQGYRLKAAEIVDVAPTLLHILEIPIPDDMDGRVLKEIFQPGSELARRDVNLTSAADVQTGGEPEEFVDDTVRQRLEDLGYF